MLVPLAAFDRRGHRIGYGAGHYDRAIARFSRPMADRSRVGVAFSVPGGRPRCPTNRMTGRSTGSLTERELIRIARTSIRT